MGADSYWLSRRRFAGGIALSGLVLAAGPRRAVAGSVDYLGQTLARGLRRYLRLDPEAANYYGLSAAEAGDDFGARINDYSPGGERARRAALSTFLAELRSIDPASLPEDHRVTWDVSVALLAAALGARQVPYGRIQAFWYTGHSPYIVNAISGPAIDTAAQMAGQAIVATVLDAEAYVAKLRAFAAAFDGVIAKLHVDAAAGVILPRPLLQKALATLRSFTEPPADRHELCTTLATKLESATIDAAPRIRLLDEAARAVAQSVYPAYRKLAVELERFAERAPAEGGLSRLPRGPELYHAAIRNLGDSEMTPEAIHTLGLDEVARIQSEMDRRLAGLGLREGSVAVRAARAFRESAGAYPDSVAGREQVLVDVRSDLEKMQRLLPRWFHPTSLPRFPLEVRRVPSFAEATVSAAYYDPPSPDGARPGIYWVNLRDLREVARSRLRTTTYHEGIPGHHLQGAVALARQEQPLIQRIANLNAFNEGWAMYAEQLASEMGVYTADPVGDLGRLSDELFRSARLVVDTGLHALGWTRQRAIEYLSQVSGTEPGRAESEIDRYLTWPGQALGYKLGMTELLRLRNEAQRVRGADFDIRDFHDVLLRNGSVPLHVARNAVAQLAKGT